MGIARELVVAVQAAEEEAEDDLADPVALGLGSSLSSSKPVPSTNSLTSTRSRESRGDHVGDDDERVAAEDARQRALVLASSS